MNDEKKILRQLINNIQMGINSSMKKLEEKNISQIAKARADGMLDGLIFALQPAFEYIKETSPENKTLIEHYEAIVNPVHERAHEMAKAMMKMDGDDFGVS